MPRLARALLALVLPLASASGLPAQAPGSPANAGGDPSAPLVHPVSLALQEWEALALTPDQVRRLRRIESEMLQGLEPLLRAQQQAAVPRSVWWGEGQVDEAALRASSLQAAEQEVEFLLRMLEVRDQVYGVLDPEQRERLRTLQREAHAANTRPVADEPHARLCTDGSSSGGGQISPRAEIQYSMDFRGDSMDVGMVFIGRAEERLYSVAKRPPRPELPGASRLLSGGTMGRWYLMYDEEQHVAWVDTQRVPLEGDNVVLLHGVERLHTPPEVVGTLRIPSTLYTGGCRDGRDPQEILREHLEQVPEIRSFLDLPPPAG